MVRALSTRDGRKARIRKKAARFLVSALSLLLVAASCTRQGPRPDAGRAGDAGQVQPFPDAGQDAGIPLPPDAGQDAGVDAGTSMPPDAGIDAGQVQPPPDAGQDARIPLPPDAGQDAGVDAGISVIPDAGVDAGTSTFAVTPRGDSYETITPASPQQVETGATASFTVIAITGHELSSTVAGTCAQGTWSGSVYTTGAVTSDCTVSFTAPVSTYQVSPTGDGNESFTPDTPQTVSYDGTQSFTLTPNSHYAVSTTVQGSCPAGTWSGSTYTTGQITLNCTVSFSATLLPTYQVTPSGDGNVTITPGVAQTVYLGSSATFTVTPPANYTVSMIVGGDCAAGTWTGTAYTTGPVTQDCTVTFAEGCETCGTQCLKITEPPAPAQLNGSSGMICGSSCVGETNLTPHCADCSAPCGAELACIEGECQCQAGGSYCVSPLPAVPSCEMANLCHNLFSAATPDPADPYSYTFVDVDGYENQDVWIYIDPVNFSTSSSDTISPFVVQCDANNGSFHAPSGIGQISAFDTTGYITNPGVLTRNTESSAIACSSMPFADVTNLGAIRNNHGYYIKYTPAPGTTGTNNAYIAIAMQESSPPSQPATFPVVYYFVNILPGTPPDLTVTASGDTGLNVTPAGASVVQYGNAPSFTVTTNGDAGLSTSVGGSCPDGGWNGSVYTAGAPFADCTVDFSSIPYRVTASGDSMEMFSPSSANVPWGSTQTFTLTTYPGYTLSAGGTCPQGTFSGDTYTTGTITQTCSVTFSATCTASACQELFIPHATVATSSLFGDTGGSAFGPDTCAPGAVLVGLAGQVGGNIDEISALCAYAGLVTNGGVTTLETSTPPNQLTTHGSGAATPFTLSCPSGQVLTRVDGYFDSEPQDGGALSQGVHQFSISCSTVSVSGGVASVSTPVLAGTTASTDDLMNSTPFSFTCSGAGVIGALSGRSGQWIDAVQFTCISPISFTVTPSGDAEVSVNPSPAAVAPGDPAMLAVTPLSGYAASARVGGTCPTGTWSGDTWTTGAVTADCTVDFTSLPLFLESQSWSTQSSSASATTSALAVTGATDTEELTYSDTTTDVHFAQSFTMQSMATTTKLLSFAWSWSGFHAYYMATAGLTAFAMGPQGTTTVALVAPSTTVSGNFSMSGTVTLPTTAGFSFGISVTGENQDSNKTLMGTVTLSAE